MLLLRILLPVLAVFLVLGCLALNGRGLESLGDPIVVIAVLFIVFMGCLPLLRQAIFTTDEPNDPPKTRKWLSKLPWLGLLLTWNSLGAVLALYVIVAVILSIQYSISIPDPPGWCKTVFFCLWFLPMPFTTLGVTTLLRRSRGTTMSKVLLIYSSVIYAVWSILVAIFIAFLLTPIAIYCGR